MKNIQELISELEVEKEKVCKELRHCEEIDDPMSGLLWAGHLPAFSLCIEKLKLLLKEETAKDLPEEGQFGD